MTGVEWEEQVLASWPDVPSDALTEAFARVWSSIEADRQAAA